ncbi:MAG: hypothetical protein LBJ31_10925 [Treponema sp.]|jgi:hypothetical protein|nr:hypothetical protein [Treponema sp.]
MEFNMDAEKFALARDLFYLSFLFLGLSAGALFRSRRHGHGHGAWFTALYCFIACSTAFLSLATIFSQGAVFTIPAIYILCTLFFAAGALGIIFPVAGCALVFTGGLITIWTVIVFARFPQFNFNSQGLSVLRENRFEKKQAYVEKISVRSAGNGILLARNGAEEDERWILGQGETLVFEAAALSLHRLFPLLGGERRGRITGVKRGSETLFFVSPGAARSLSSSKPAMNSQVFTLDLPASLRPGISLSVIFDGSSLFFDPPLRPET